MIHMHKAARIISRMKVQYTVFSHLYKPRKRLLFGLVARSSSVTNPLLDLGKTLGCIHGYM
jgi:hypothetical protein